MGLHQVGPTYPGPTTLPYRHVRRNVLEHDGNARCKISLPRSDQDEMNEKYEIHLPNATPNTMPKKHEREQTLTPQSSPSPDSTKRPKTQALISSPISPHSSKEKGKAKIEQDEKDNDERGDQEMDLCGICLSEEGKAIRGQIDSCDHYFCFVCIMEWSKLESRCPICKQRFGSIRRLPKEGVFSRERIVQVPVRDQVRS